MDVRCDQCKTEYELEDSRITPEGVTVKCTECGYVFKVRKKATLGGSRDDLPPTDTHPARAREWKVRQAKGNVFTFRELTTLQKWIVERKVTRDDEISLTGDTWKRLGNIAELASFFQVVDEAQRATELEALHRLGAAMPPPTGQVMARPPPPVATDPALVLPPGLSAQAPISSPEAPVGGVAALEVSPGAQQQAAGPIALGEPLVLRQEPGFGAAEVTEQIEQDALEKAAFRRSSPRRWLSATVTLVLLAALAFVAYRVGLPMLESELSSWEGDGTSDGALDGVAPGPGQGMAPGSAPALAQEPGREVDAEPGRDAGARPEGAADSERPDEPGGGVGAGVATGVGGGPAAAAADVPPETPAPGEVRVASRDLGRARAPLDYAGSLAEADRLRERGKLTAALAAYQRAMALSPERAEPVAGRGLALLDLGRTSEAIDAFGKALELNASYGTALIGMAESLKAVARTDEARRYYQRYLDLLPEGPEAAVARGALERLDAPVEAPSPASPPSTQEPTVGSEGEGGGAVPAEAPPPGGDGSSSGEAVSTQP